MWARVKGDLGEQRRYILRWTSWGCDLRASIYLSRFLGFRSDSAAGIYREDSTGSYT